MLPLDRSRELAACLALVGLATSAAVEARATDRPLAASNFVGNQSCSSVSCHGSSEPRSGSTGVHQQAYHLWLAHDPHARAGLTMLEPRFQEILRKASGRVDGGVDSRIAGQCAQCHDPHNIREGKAHGREAEAINREGEAINREGEAINREGEAPAEPILARGIGCETCHGPASRWLARHYEQGVSRDELRELGMVDTKDLSLRARMCASCHVGSAENDLTHDMLAAGHPPLWFELASQQALIERKHWNESLRRRVEPDFDVRLWSAGRIASAQAALELLEARAKKAAAVETRINTDGAKACWPEFAEYDCFGCHQTLRPAVDARSATTPVSRTAGAPGWRQWNVECVPGTAPEFAAALDALRQVMEQSYSPAPSRVAELAAAARQELASAPQPSSVASDALVAVAQRRCELTWERACHELAALRAVDRGRRDHAGSGEQNRRFISGTERIAASLRFIRPDSAWPGVLEIVKSDGLQFAGRMTLEQVAAELERVRIELAKSSDMSSRFESRTEHKVLSTEY